MFADGPARASKMPTAMSSRYRGRCTVERWLDFEGEWRNVGWFGCGLAEELGGLRLLWSQQAKPAVRHWRQLVASSKAAVRRTAILHDSPEG